MKNNIVRPVEIVVEENHLNLSIDANSNLREGVHRIFLTNVLGFEQGDDARSYSIQGKPDIVEHLIELLQYLKENDLDYRLNESASHIVDNFVSSSSLLEDARKEGRRIKRKHINSIKIPNFVRRLKPYQIPAVLHMLRIPHAANFSVPGSGKTSIVLATYAVLRTRGEIDKMVVVGPRASFMPWEEEFFACFGRKPKALRIVGPKARRKKLYRDGDAEELVLLTYQMASQDGDLLRSFLSRNKAVLILDESHNIKRLEGGKWSNEILALSTSAKKRVILTGTPVPNALQDIWSQMTFLWPNPPLLGDGDQFRDRVANPTDITVNELRKEIYPFYWRIRKKDLGLRRPQYHRLDVKMKPHQQAIYSALAVKILSDLVKAPDERTKLRIWRKARMVRLLQSASNPSLLKHYSTEFKIPPLDATGLSIDQLIEKYWELEVPTKIDALSKLTRQLIKRKQKVIIWTAFVHNIKTLHSLFSDLNPRIVFGEIPKDESEDREFNREKMIREFKTDPSYKLLIANPGACAESISLHKICHHAIYLDRTLNCAHYLQSMDRIHRIGLDPTEQVHYYIIRSLNSIDMVIDERLRTKQKNMLKMLDEDFSIMDLDSSGELFSEESEEEADFNALVKYLQKLYH